MSMNLVVLPLSRRDGLDESYLPGLFATAGPRRAVRGRKEDRLIMHLSMKGELVLNADQQEKVLDDMAQGYFRSSGSVTAGLREQAERLNLYLLNRNQQAASAGKQSLALLTLAVQREEGLILGLCGPVHAFLLTRNGIQHFYDPPNAGRGLGLSRTTDVRFFQADFRPGDILLCLPELPSGWDERTFQGVHGQKLATLRRRFLSGAGDELQAALIVGERGGGEVRLLSSRAEVEGLDATPPVSAAQRSSTPRPLVVQEASRTREAAAARAGSELEDTGPITVRRQSQPGGGEKAWQAQPGTEPLPIWEELWARLNEYGARIWPPLRDFWRRMLPDENALNLPPSTLALIAGLVPVVVVVLVSVIYLQVGRGQLYENYLAQAQSAAAVAEAREEPDEVRRAWEVVLHYAQRAVAYQNTEEAAALQAEAQAALDGMELIERVDFQLALFSRLPDEVEIAQMAATSNELFMLDAARGKVLRAFLTGGGYRLDEAFRCGPGPYGGIIVSELIDLALLPRGNPQNAALVAMDANGNLIYCIVDDRPLAQVLAPPDSQWGDPKAITVEDENLYVLDPLTNAVWIYFGTEFSFVEPPRFFFGAEVPRLQEVLDLALDEEQLYLLNVDGRVAQCTFSDNLESPTTCQNPLGYTDSRPGRSDGDTIEGAHFLQLQITDPPEPSVYMLDPIVPAVYQFSLRMNLVRQFRTVSELPEGVASAFAVSPNRAIFLAFDNEIYIGFLP